MKIARHWIRETVESLDSRGHTLRTSAWGWSAANIEEARRQNQNEAAQAMEMIGNMAMAMLQESMAAAGIE